jgi:hypothetical protein
VIEIKNIPAAMIKAALKLRQGPILIVYRDGSVIRCELEHADDPYVWRKGKWVPMKC